MTDLRSETLALIRRRLAERFPDEHRANPVSLDEFAEGLHATAIKFDVPVDSALLPWIEDRIEGKDWSLAAWRLWCDRYAALRAEFAQPSLCHRCGAHPVTLTKAGKWQCPACGEVEHGDVEHGEATHGLG